VLASVDRIAILGCGGSGKTTVGRRLAAHLNVPLTHLDGLYYDSYWNTLPPEKFAALQEEIVAGPRWVIDGNFTASMPIRFARADTVIFLDIPPIVCLWGILQRRYKYRGGQHAAQGVYDRITWNFIRYVMGFRRSMRPRVRAMISQHATHADVVILTSRRAARRYLETVALPA
jgi:adenylate kinase family enzyme